MTQVLVSVLVLSWLLIGVQGWLLLVLVRQHGRTLLAQDDVRGRLTATEEALARLAPAPPAVRQTPAAPQPQPQPQGLPLGAPAPDFALPDLKGRLRNLADVAREPSLLVFFNPDCGFCAQLAPRLGQLPAGSPRLVLVSRGDAARHRRLAREHGWKAEVLLESGWEVTNAYATNGTPTGYLLDEGGRIASTLAVGADAILALARVRAGNGHDPTAAGLQAKHAQAAERAREAGLAVRESTLSRDGLAAGMPAPLFTLPAVGGGERSLADYRGRRVLLVFSDPGCGPCQGLAPDLERLHRRAPVSGGPEVLVVSRGSEADNLAKVREHGLTFPVLLQNGWQTSKDYAMFATPIGYLIDERGLLETGVAVGAEAILKLAA